MESSINFKNLEGIHILTGVEYGLEKYNDYFEHEAEDKRQYVVFELDGIQYLASEDPDDGYRSSCDSLEIVDNKIKNIFHPINVFCKMRDSDDDYENDVLEIYDCKTSKLILAIGTMNTEDYYPWFEFEYHPEDMIVNESIIPYKVEFNIKGHLANTLSSNDLGKHKDGWEIKGDIHKDYYEWVNEFEAIHPKYGRVWGDFEQIVYADNKEGYDDFISKYSPESWDYWDI